MPVPPLMLKQGGYNHINQLPDKLTNKKGFIWGSSRSC